MIPNLFVTAKLGTMRKPQSFIVYPASRSEAGMVIQSDTRICSFNPETGAGMLSAAKSNGAYFMHLLPMMGATPVVVPAEVIAAALAAQPKSGQSIGGGVRIA